MKTDLAEKWPDGTPLARLRTQAAFEHAAECLGLSVRPSIWGSIAVDASTGARVDWTDVEAEWRQMLGDR